MSHYVPIPIWLLLLLGALALWATFEHLVRPAVLWFLRRRVNRVVEEIGTRLKIEIPSFKLMRREVLIDRLVHDPVVQKTLDSRAEGDNKARSELMRQVDLYAREIVPSFNAYVYFRLGYWIAKSVARFLFRVRLGYSDSDALAAVNPKSTVVFVQNHRSNMDYVLVAFLAAERTALSYAVGEWARVWPLQPLIRSMGAYFVRRNSSDPLYRMVLQRYVHMATQAGVCQAVFPEGGLSLDGKLRQPKLGLLDYMLKGFDPTADRDLVFVPVGINYDRVLEDRSLLRRTDAAATHRGAIYATIRTLEFVAKNLWLLMTGRWYRFGYACVNFGAPISMRDYLQANRAEFRLTSEEDRKLAVEAFGRKLMERIGELVPVLPVSLVASVFLRNPGRRISELELKFGVYSLMKQMESRGAHLYIPRGDHDYAISVGLRMLTLRRLVLQSNGLFYAHRDEEKILAYYANSIEHLSPRLALGIESPQLELAVARG